jgi:tetratricopeptide (TPR) repeat protein
MRPPASSKQVERMLQWIREQWHQAQLRDSTKTAQPGKNTEREVLLFSGLWRELQDNHLDSVVSAAGGLLEHGTPQELIEACKILAHAHLNNHRHQEAVSYFQFVAEQQNTPDAWFNLATAATLAKDFVTSQPAYMQALQLSCEAGLPCHYSIPYMRMNFCNALDAQEEHDQALEQLQLLLHSYRESADRPPKPAAILPIQPSLPQLLTVASRILTHHAQQEAESWYHTLAQGLSTQERQLLARFHIHVIDSTPSESEPTP